MRYLITDFCRDDQPVINNLRAMGYFVYALRAGEGEHYTVEPKAFVNNIGFVVTDKPIVFHEEGSRQYITDIELVELGTEDVSIKSVIECACDMKRIEQSITKIASTMNVPEAYVIAVIDKLIRM